MIRRRRDESTLSTLSTKRVEGFTDGVFAIAATLLVLDLTSYGFGGDIRTDAALWSAVGDMSELFVNFALSFVLLCLLWMTHVSQFEHIARVDTAMVWLNNIRLLFIVLVPFSTGLATEYDSFAVGRVMLPITFFAAILVSWVQWGWAMRHRESMMPDLSAHDARALGRGALSAVLIAAVVVALSFWAGSIAFVLFLLDGVLTRALRRGDK